MNQADRAYYLMRAEREIDLAERASSEVAGRIHHHLAAAYLELVHGEGSARGELERGLSNAASAYH